MDAATADILPLKFSDWKGWPSTFKEVLLVDNVYVAPVPRINAELPKQDSSTNRGVLQIHVEARQKSILMNNPVEAFGNLTKLAKKKFGFFTGKRIKKFTKYSSGWDGDGASPASPLSASLMASFIRSYSKFHTAPSFFLTRQGHFAIAWDSASGCRVDVVFEEDICAVESEFYSGQMHIKYPEDLQGLIRALS